MVWSLAAIRIQDQFESKKHDPSDAVIRRKPGLGIYLCLGSYEDENGGRRGKVRGRAAKAVASQAPSETAVTAMASSFSSTDAVTVRTSKGRKDLLGGGGKFEYLRHRCG